MLSRKDKHYCNDTLLATRLFIMIESFLLVTMIDKVMSYPPHLSQKLLRVALFCFLHTVWKAIYLDTIIIRIKAYEENNTANMRI